MPAHPLRILIIGAGFSGLCAAIQLKRAGFERITLIDRGDEVGGTWRDNSYPGCACDIPSHLYSFSFDARWDWTRPYGQRAEIFAYLRHMADKHDLRRHLRLGVQAQASTWLEDRQLWQVSLLGGEVLEAEVLIGAIGALVKPALPKIDGLDSFAGPVFHSARWRHDVDLSGLRVALIGTGASAIQVAPEVAALASRLSIFQRTAPWVLPRGDRPYSPVKRWLYRNLPGLLRLNRWRIYALNELLTLGFLGNRRLQKLMSWAGTQHLRRRLKDAALLAKATPDHAPGCKRILVSDAWYPTLKRPNVALVTEPIERITPQGIVTRDGVQHAVDVVVVATGFVVTEFTALTNTQGRGGADLAARWMQGAATHLGLVTHGFPNLFTLLGPNTGLGSNSIVFMIEAQVNYLVQAVQHLARFGGTLEVRAEVQARSYADVQRRMQGTVWVSGCKSWYQSEGGRIDTLWPGFTTAYWWRSLSFDAADYLSLARTA